MKNILAVLLLICLLLTAVSCTGDDREEMKGSGTGTAVTQTDEPSDTNGENTSGQTSNESTEPMWTPNY